MVMITDGPLNHSVIWDCVTDLDGGFVRKSAKDSGLDGYSQGNYFISYSKTISSGWDWMADTYIDVEALDATAFANGIWFNMRINTGYNNGYCQIEFGQNGSGLTWFNFLKSQGYGDDYAFTPTNNKWEWRSVKINPDSFGLDPFSPFYIKIGATTGNYSSGVYELNLDYLLFTTVPMDTNLNPDDL